jgi:hypothetical protein
MSSEERFFIVCWSILATTVISIAAAITINNQMNNNAVIAMVKEGKDPLESSCAISNSQLTIVACSQYAIKKESR